MYDTHAPAVAGYARGKGVEDPELLANETLYRVMSGLDSFDGTPERVPSPGFSPSRTT